MHPSLALNTSLHGTTPGNLIRVILDGIGSPARPELGTMPAYRDSFNGAQVAELVSYLRVQLAGGKPAWGTSPRTWPESARSRPSNEPRPQVRRSARLSVRPFVRLTKPFF
ncbi:mono/diheme cytochrome c family protein [Paraburkholderia atlantica]